jgi:hypothetical protein
VGFTCSLCGAYHDERILDVRLELPEAIYRLSERERTRLAWLADDTAVLEPPGEAARFFVRGLVEIRIPELHDRFAYGVWVELAEEDWHRVAELWTDPNGRDHPPFEGRLANELDPYVATEGLPVLLQLEEVERLPSVAVGPSAHPLAVEQRDGISVERCEQLAATVMH